MRHGGVRAQAFLVFMSYKWESWKAQIMNAGTWWEEGKVWQSAFSALASHFRGPRLDQMLLIRHAEPRIGANIR